MRRDDLVDADLGRHRGGGRASARETAMRVAAGGIAKKYLRERFCRFGFANPRRPHKEERADRAARILEVGAGAAEGAGDDFEKAFYAVRGKMPAKVGIEYKAVSPGQRLVGLDKTTGKPTGDVIEGDRKSVV